MKDKVFLVFSGCWGGWAEFKPGTAAGVGTGRQLKFVTSAPQQPVIDRHYGAVIGSGWWR
jgi:hypothetical protein